MASVPRERFTPKEIRKRVNEGGQSNKNIANAYQGKRGKKSKTPGSQGAKEKVACTINDTRRKGSTYSALN